MSNAEISVRQESSLSSTLAELVEVANAEYDQALSSAYSAVIHGFNCGDALLKIRELVPRGDWRKWLQENFNGGETTAREYMRLAKYRDLVPPEYYANRQLAMDYLKGLPHTDSERPSTIPREEIEEVRRLAESGMSQEQISKALGMSRTQVRSRLDPEKSRKDHQRFGKKYEAQRKRAKSAREALRREEVGRERLALMKQTGGNIAKSYALIRLAAQELDRARLIAKGHEAKLAINAALSKVYAAEDDLVRAVRES